MHSLIAITRLSLLQVLPSQSSPSYGTLTTTTISPCVIRATLNNPPVNLWDFRLAADFYSFINSLAAETTIINGTNLTVITDTKVVILSSANPDFWIAHYDIHALTVSSPELPPANGTLIGEQLLRSRTLLATLPVIFIAEINGLASGAGNEVAVQCDIRYAGPVAKLGHIEVGFGLPPGAGGVQFLVKLIGRTRALEHILSARSVDAVTAAAIGWVNLAFGSAQELRSEVDALATRIATFSKQRLAAIKARVNVQKQSDADLQGDNDLFFELVGTEVTQKAGDRFLVLGGYE